MQYTYQATVEEDPDGGFIVTFADVPEAITAGDTFEEAMTNAREALGLALRGILQDGRDLPQPAAHDGVPVAVAADEAAKLAVIQAFRQAGISKSELARRLGKTETEARRILDPDHGTKIGLLQEALLALGQEIVVTVRKAA
ncbi:type II toxin-antitoxin system HicB family antitoxin [Rhizobium cremeum]|uniref:type II toxin-antitoxin system HicB family antitoxin n=1 Tax=Rhizobium cremeum TaxID=2813827 RepID=UPI000DDE38DC|nr:type II toxin-antitoxin system HicB family antitoxin [Rhizobium cremeum]MCJ7996671.1 type II toxin-antitoxin system HicB family antitoxin [Rhizobium cremeum]MCJ7999395.1 type II toxin-antitoxin system HicB family antitoxin [Rhizobium cremeum]